MSGDDSRSYGYYDLKQMMILRAFTMVNATKYAFSHAQVISVANNNNVPQCIIDIIRNAGRISTSNADSGYLYNPASLPRSIEGIDIRNWLSSLRDMQRNKLSPFMMCSALDFLYFLKYR